MQGFKSNALITSTLERVEVVSIFPFHLPGLNRNLITSVLSLTHRDLFLAGIIGFERTYILPSPRVERHSIRHGWYVDGTHLVAYRWLTG